MTKIISLTERAYGTPKKHKTPGESFSDVVLRITSERKGESLLRFSGAWKGNDIDEVFSAVLKDRKRSASRKIEI